MKKLDEWLDEPLVAFAIAVLAFTLYFPLQFELGHCFYNYHK